MLWAETWTAFPVQGCTSVSTNTGTGQPTYLPNKNNYKLWLSEALPGTAPDTYLFITSYDDSGSEVRFYNKDGTLRYSGSLSSGTNFKSVILKDPLKLFVAQSTAKDEYLYTVTISGTTYTVSASSTTAGLNPASNRVSVSLSDPSTVYIFVHSSTSDTVGKFDVSAALTFVSSGSPNYGSTVFYLAFMTAGANIFSADPIHVSLYNKADFSQVKSATYQYTSCSMVAWCADNLSDGMAFSTTNCYSGNYIVRHNIGTLSGSTLNPDAYEVKNPGNTADNILNFGPYQYVVTIKTNTASALIYFFLKTDLTQTPTVALSNTAGKVFSDTLRGFIAAGDRYYFGFIDQQSDKNFQSYYLQLDLCITRTASICTQCPAGYYLNNALVNNLCILLESFPAGYGADNTTKIMTPCLLPTCTNCLYDYTVCSSCDPATGYFWDNSTSTCLYYTAIPNGYGGNLTDGSVWPCAAANCLTCKADSSICTGCNTAGSYYKNNATGLCVHVSLIANTFGANATDGSIWPCQDSHCTICNLNSAQCLTCDTASGYYRLNSSQTCVLWSSIANGYGANATDGSIWPCLDTHCTVCKANSALCTQCDTASNYYRDNTTQTCILSSSIANGYGANSTDGSIWPCLDTHCVVCKLNSALCTTCDTSSGYYRDNTTMTCVHTSVIPTGYGANLTNGQIWPCSISNCQTCNTDSSTCIACNTAGSYYKNNATGLCVFVNMIAAGYGANATDGSIWPCAISQCSICKANSAVCTTCNTAAGYYKDTVTGLCVHTSAIPNGFGANSTDGTIWPCLDTHCTVCNTNSGSCSQCDVAGLYFRNSVTNACVYVTSIPAGKGGNTTTGIFETCWTPNCNLCQSDSLVCTACNTASQYYMNTTSQTCVYYLSIISTYGADLPTGTIMPCVENHCTLCRADRTICTGCDTASLYYLNTTAKTCILESSIITGYGANLGTGHIVACTDSHCLDCRANYLQCSACDTANAYYLNTTSQTCLLVSSIPAGYGADLGAGTVVQCQDTLCMACQANYQVCSACDTGSGYYRNTTSSICVLNTLIINGFGAKLSDGTIAACTDTHCQVCNMNNVQCSQCDTASYYFLDTVTNNCILNSTLGNGLGPNLVNGRVTFCNDPNCLDCKATYLQCKGCDTGGGFYLNTTSMTCIENINIIAGYGADSTTGTIMACSDIHCLTCQLDRAFCDTCNTGASYYRNVTSGTCVLMSSITSGNGADLTTGDISPCSDSSCGNCRSNYQVCSGCDDAAGYFLDTLANTCVHYTLIADFYGADHSTGTVSGCSVANCKLCKANVSNCIGCDVPNSYFQNPATLMCAYVSNIPGGYGANTTTGFFEPCWTSHCVDCQLDSTVCTTCDVSSLYYLDPLSQGCILNTMIADFKGPNILTGLVDNCVDVHCRNCKTNINFCSFCDTLSNYYYNSSIASCVLESTIASGFGADPATSLIKPCTSAGCTNCQSNYLLCSVCDTGNHYYLDSGSSQCVLDSNIPNYQGANHLTGAISACNDPFCVVCKMNYQVCTTCNLAVDYYLDVSGACIHVSSIPPGQGANSTTGRVDNCWTTHCSLCQVNSLVCTSCDTASGYYLDLNSNVCILDTTISPGFGADHATGTVQPCADTNCLLCQLNALACTACNVAGNYYLDTGLFTCVEKNNIPGLFGADLVNGIVAPCADTHCLVCQQDYTKCTGCATASHYFLNELIHNCIHDTLIPNYYGANLTAGVVSPCQVPFCKQCQMNNLLCTICDSSSSYFMDPTTLACVYYQNIQDGKGGNLITGYVAPCDDANCLNCKADIAVCIRCDTSNGYYLNSTINGCVMLPDVTLGYGGDLVQGNLKACVVVGCLDCRLDYMKCMLCDTANLFYFNGTSEGCTYVTSIANGYGANLVDGYIENCFDSACKVCQHDSNVCEHCKVSDGFYLDTGSQACVKSSDIPSFYGGDPVSGTILHCQLAGCILCQDLYSKCDACDVGAGLYLAVDGAACVNSFAPGFGPDTQAGVVKACAESKCLHCEQDYAVCEFCDVAQYYYLDNGHCSPTSSAPAGMGLDVTTSQLETCLVELCAECNNDFNICKKCYESMGYFLEGNICVLMDAKLVVAESSDKPAGVDSRFAVTTNPQLTVDTSLLYAGLKPQIQWKIAYLKASTGKPETVQFKSNILSSASGLFNEITLSEMLPEKKYTINVTCPAKYYNVTINGVLYRLSFFSGVFPFENTVSAAEVAGAASTGSAVSNIFGGSLTSSAAFLPVMMGVIAMDPTGVLMKFNQILKIINKLYFININYGTRLTAFLGAIGEMGGGTIVDSKKFTVHHISSYRGKLTKSNLATQYWEAMNYRIGLYLGIWLIWIVHWTLMKLKVKIHAKYLYVLHFGRKVHLIIFNLVFIDFIWYGGHTLLHSRDSLTDQILALTTLLLVIMDLTTLLDTAFDQRNWLYWISLKKVIEQNTLEQKKLMHFEELKKKKKEKKLKIKKEVKEKKVRGRTVQLPEFEGDDPDSDNEKGVAKKKEAVRRVHFTNTYDEINSNFHLFSLMSFNLQTLARVYLNPLARSLLIFHILRTISYQAFVLAGQYSSGLTICLLLFIEISKIGYVGYYYVKYKYLKNIICLLMEVMQSFFLVLFLLIAMILHPKGHNEIILDFYQDAGIWIVIASCVAEYLLLLTYIGVAAYDFFKNRKALNRALKKMKYSFIKYGEDKSIVEETTGPIFTTFDTARQINGESQRGAQKLSLVAPIVAEVKPIPSKGEPMKTIMHQQILSPRQLMNTALSIDIAKVKEPSSPTSPKKSALRRINTKDEPKKTVGWAAQLKQKLDSKPNTSIPGGNFEDNSSTKSTGFSEHNLQGLRMAHRINKAKLKMTPATAGPSTSNALKVFKRVNNFIGENDHKLENPPAGNPVKKIPNPASAFVKNLRNLKFPPPPK
jgi:hypothetical protein